ncbi:Mu transposase C-terminal domain-containing protein [Aquitalea aquatilis]|uniref:Mu transposase C-terminal domain-containing protein n=1 Tax=Aquitalea aquatilis TaxID=1537400 RepID=UPI0010BD3651|nr:DDE-type integrase/transposase/recombinase [Aquitalea aquatilis]
MSQAYTPKVGMRFVIYGCEFEITYVAHGWVRYAAAIGGKPYRIPYERFMEMQGSGSLQIQLQEAARLSAKDHTLKVSEQTEEETQATIRRARYVEAAIAQLTHPRSIKQLTAFIPALAYQLEDVTPPSPRTVCLWVKKYFDAGRIATTFVSQKCKRGNRTLRFPPDVEILITEGIQQVYLQPERRDCKDVLVFIVGRLAELGMLTKEVSSLRLPTLRTIQRRVKALDPYVVARARHGKEAAERVARAAGRQIISPRAMFLVQIDTHYLDITLLDPDTGEVIGRPYLVCIIDVYTRAIVGVYISMLPPSATTTLAAVKDMLTRLARGLPGGIPVKIIPDNGIEFKNSAFVRLCARLGIIINPAEIRDPNDKPHIESFFRTLTYFLVQKCAGTTFSNPAARGDYDSHRKAALILEKLIEYINEWIDNVYHQTIHSRTGRAPILAWKDATQNWEAPIFETGEIDAIARRPETRTIHRGRVVVDHIEYFSHALATLEALKETRVTVLVNELDLHEVYIEHPSERGVLIRAESTNPDYTHGLTWHEHQEAQKIKAALTESDRQRLGPYCDLLARWTLFQKIQADSALARRQIARLTNGKGRQQPQLPGHAVEALSHSSLALQQTITPALPELLATQLPSISEDLPSAAAGNAVTTYEVIDLE